MCGPTSIFNPIGFLAKVMGNTCVTATINLFLNICSLVVLCIAARQNFMSSDACGDSFREIAAFSGGAYARWIWIGGALATALAILNVLELILDTICDFCLRQSDANTVTGNMEKCLRLVQQLKKYYMLLTNAVEPFFLMYFTWIMTRESLEAIDDLDSFMNVTASFSTFLTQNQEVAEETITAERSCVQNRYTLIADTGIGALFASTQSAVRLYLDVTRYVEKEIDGDEGDRVEHYKKAYERAKTEFGPAGALVILMGYSDDYSDLALIARSMDLPPEVEGLLVDRFEDYTGCCEGGEVLDEHEE